MTNPGQIIRPRLDWYGAVKTAYTFNGVHVLRHGKRIRVLGKDMNAETADGVGRVLIELAEVAKAEPDPLELAALKETIAEANIAAFDDVDADQVARRLLARYTFNLRPDVTA